MRLYPVVTILGLCLLGRSASAQPGAAPYAPPAAPYAAPDAKSPGTALLLALGGTAAGIGLLASGDDSETAAWAGLLGVVVAPSLGHFYTGEGTRALLGIGMRGVGMTALIYGFVQVFEECFDCRDRADPAVLIYGGIGLAAAGTLYSILDAPLSAKRVNERARTPLLIAPAPIAIPGQRPAPGLHVSGSF